MVIVYLFNVFMHVFRNSRLTRFSFTQSNKCIVEDRGHGTAAGSRLEEPRTRQSTSGSFETLLGLRTGGTEEDGLRSERRPGGEPTILELKEARVPIGSGEVR